MPFTGPRYGRPAPKKSSDIEEKRAQENKGTGTRGFDLLFGIPLADALGVTACLDSMAAEACRPGIPGIHSMLLPRFVDGVPSLGKKGYRTECAVYPWKFERTA